MLICFVLAPRERQLAGATRRVEGRAQCLSVFRELDEGPFYPTLYEAADDAACRFFAGRVLDTPVIGGVPVGHPVSSAPDAPWNFPGGEADGSWIALKFDRRTGYLSAAADVFNVQRWFYAERGGAVYVSNSLRYLYRVLDAKPALEQRAIPYMLRSGYVPHEFTPLADVYELDAGQVLTVEAGAVRIESRALLPVLRRPVDPQAADGHTIATSLMEAVARECEGAGHVVLPLSGGMDSRFLLGCALAVLPREALTTMTFGEKRSYDFQIGTRLAQKLGVHNIPLAMDRRPLREILRENFATAEGMYATLPDYPVEPYREALAPGSFVLSGYIGDPIFGSKEKGEDWEQNPAGKTDKLLAQIRASTMFVPWEDVRPLLAVDDSDPLRILDRYRDLPGRTLQEQSDYWYFWTHTINRTHYAVTPARHRAFFMMPLLQRRVLNLAFSLPPAARRKQQAYFSAMKSAFPDLYAFPTSRNYGYALDAPPSSVKFARAWRKLGDTVDDIVGTRTGRILYHHPKTKYAHPRWALMPEHRELVLECFDRLKSLSAFDPQGLDALRQRYLAGRKISKPLMQVLLTVHQWTLHYPGQ